MLEKIGQAAKQASYLLAALSAAHKNQLLVRIAQLLEQQSEILLLANQKDIDDAIENGANAALLDRLLLTPDRLASIAHDVRRICNLADPIGTTLDGAIMESGLRLSRRCVPLGVVGVIYEARPNVTIDVAALCLKTGNAAILRGGKETQRTNLALITLIQQALTEQNLPKTAIQFIDNPDRALVQHLLKLDRYIDIIIPRGGAALHQFCKTHSMIPVITGGIGVCHIFVDESADLAEALLIIENAKTQRPTTCNTVETLLVHRAIAAQFLPQLCNSMANKQVTLHVDAETLLQLSKGRAKLKLLEEKKLYQEWLSLDLNVVIVDTLTEAIEHIHHYGSAHSEAILTRSMANANAFVERVDAAAVYVNASTRFTDGGQFGLGAEIAVSTQKLHARGPMGLAALTTYKWIGYGDDLIRQSSMSKTD